MILANAHTARVRKCFDGHGEDADDLAAQYIAAETELRELARTHKASRAMLDALAMDAPLYLARAPTVRALLKRRLAHQINDRSIDDAYRTEAGRRAQSLMCQLRALRSNMMNAPALLKGLR